MKLTDLLLNRFLYKDNLQNLETKDSVYNSGNVTPASVPPVPAGGAAQDINAGNVTINGIQLTPGTLPPSLLDVSNFGWGQTCAFTSTSATQVNWGAGTFKSASGISYSISAGNTGAMSAKTYIYLDLNVSSTTYQTTTTSATAVGLGKVLIAVAQNGATTATYNLNEASQIVSDNILANTIDASKLNVGQLSAITADIGTVTAGTITGLTVQTAASGQRTVMTALSAGLQSFNEDGTSIATLQPTSSGALFSATSPNTASRMFQFISFIQNGYNNNPMVYLEAADVSTGTNLLELQQRGDKEAIKITQYSTSSGNAINLLYSGSATEAVKLINDTASVKVLSVSNTYVSSNANVAEFINAAGASGATVYVRGQTNIVAPLETRQDAVTSTHFYKVERLNGANSGSSSVSFWTSDGTTPNGNLTGGTGDICFGADGGKAYYCTVTTNWTAM